LSGADGSEIERLDEAAVDAHHSALLVAKRNR
jgi:hypothetical protein